MPLNVVKPQLAPDTSLLYLFYESDSRSVQVVLEGTNGRAAFAYYNVKQVGCYVIQSSWWIPRHASHSLHLLP